ncbi:hypothetical protein CUZ98_0398 [Enterococcus faecium]|nr:hypothetical protein [Enterococcus faecium]
MFQVYFRIIVYHKNGKLVVRLFENYLFLMINYLIFNPVSGKV